MARSRDPFNQALSALRAGLADGRLRGGEPVIVASEAGRLNLSITPVREALARLNGEGLVERAPGGGYLVARLEGSDAADGYRLQLHQLRLANLLSDGIEPVPVMRPTPKDADDPGAALHLFDRIMRSAGSGMLAACHARVRLRLAPLRRAERWVFRDLEAEADALYEAAAASPQALDMMVGDYFDRRIRASSVLVRVAEDHGPDSPTG